MMNGKMKTLSTCMSGVILLLSVSGCTHQLQVKNLNSYRNMSINPLEKRIAIGIVPSTTEVDSKRLVKGIGDALAKSSASVLLPYSENSAKKVDAIAKISVRTEYKGSGWNFLVNFPGFLVFAPAWNGYIYKVDYYVDVLLTKASDRSKIASWSIPVKLDIRHADTNRTWTEISWLEIGVIAFIGGIVFIEYDKSVTPLIADKIEVPVGDYIAQEIINRLNNSGEFSYIQGHLPAKRLAMLPRGKQSDTGE